MVTTVSEIQFPQFRRLLLGAIGHLCRQGFSVPPSEVMDLLHDFYADAWHDLSVRYDPSRGKPETYVYRAFVLYARPRIIRMRRWQMALIETEELTRILEDRSLSKEQPVDSDIQAV